MTDRYTASVEADVSSDEVNVEIKDSGSGAQKSGHVALYYDGPEAFGDLPELVENRRVVAINWDGVETDVPNVAGGATLPFDVPERFVDGHGEWIVFFGATDDPLARVHAAEARS